MPALVYFARPGGEGRPKPGYVELVIAAAREWRLPEDHIVSLRGLAGRARARRRRAQARGIQMSRPAKLIRHVVIRGRVQGVGFRAFVEEQAAP